MAGWTFTPGVNVAEIVKPRIMAAIEETLAVIKEDAMATAPSLTGAIVADFVTAVDPATLQGGVGNTNIEAVAAHENMHDHLKNGKRAKFLELAVSEHASDLTTKLRGVFG